MSMESLTLQQLIKQTIHQYVSSDVHIQSIKSNPPGRDLKPLNCFDIILNSL